MVGSSTGTILTVLTALGIGSVVTALVAGLFQRRKVSGDYVTAIAGAATTLVQPLQAEVARLQGDLEKQKSQCTQEVAALRDELEETRQDLREARVDAHEEVSRLREELGDAQRILSALRRAGKA